MESKGAEDSDDKELEEVGFVCHVSQRWSLAWAWPTFRGVPQGNSAQMSSLHVSSLLGGLWTLPVFSTQILEAKACSRAPLTRRLFLVRVFKSVLRFLLVRNFTLGFSRR